MKGKKTRGRREDRGNLEKAWEFHEKHNGETKGKKKGKKNEGENKRRRVNVILKNARNENQRIVIPLTSKGSALEFSTACTFWDVPGNNNVVVSGFNFDPLPVSLRH